MRGRGREQPARARFVQLGRLVVLATIASAVWRSTTFVRLGTMVDDTLRGSQEVIDLTAGLASVRAREDERPIAEALGGRAP